jgi:ribosome-associated protein
VAKEPTLSNSEPVSSSQQTAESQLEGHSDGTEVPAADPTGQAPAAEAPFDDEELIGWLKAAAVAADDKLGRRIEVFFVGGVLGITDWFVITSARNQRQVRAIVDAVEEAVDRVGGPKPNRVEGRDSFNWVLMDYGIFVVHVFTDEARELYDLERLWSDVVRLPVELPSARAAS